MAVFVPRFLRQLRDVAASAPADGEVLTFDTADGLWKPAAGGGGGGPPTGAAGGVLSGTYPNPGFAADMATQAELDVVAAVVGSLPRDIAQVAHGLSVGNAVRFNGTAYVKAQANSAANSEVVGIVSAVASADAFTLTSGGHITGLSGLTAGEVYFLSPSSAGALTATEPSTGGQVTKPLLIADSTTSGYIFNFRGSVVPGSGSGAQTFIYAAIYANSRFNGYTFPQVVSFDPDTELYFAPYATCSEVFDLTAVQSIRCVLQFGPTAPQVPAGLAALAAGWGADPADVWDVTGSVLRIVALTGADAGKVAQLKPNQATPHPVTDYLGSNASVALEQISGDLVMTFSETNHLCHVPSSGSYSVSWNVVTDLFYP